MNSLGMFEESDVNPAIDFIDNDLELGDMKDLKIESELTLRNKYYIRKLLDELTTQFYNSSVSQQILSAFDIFSDAFVFHAIDDLTALSSGKFTLIVQRKPIGFIFTFGKVFKTAYRRNTNLLDIDTEAELFVSIVSDSRTVKQINETEWQNEVCSAFILVPKVYSKAIPSFTLPDMDSNQQVK